MIDQLPPLESACKFVAMGGAVRVIERFKALTDDGKAVEIEVRSQAPINAGHLEDSESSLDRLPEYRTVDGRHVQANSDGSFALCDGTVVWRLP